MSGLFLFSVGLYHYSLVISGISGCGLGLGSVFAEVSCFGDAVKIIGKRAVIIESEYQRLLIGDRAARICHRFYSIIRNISAA